MPVTEINKFVNKTVMLPCAPRMVMSMNNIDKTGKTFPPQKRGKG